MIGQNQQNSDEQRFDGLLRPTKLEGSRAGTSWQSELHCRHGYLDTLRVGNGDGVGSAWLHKLRDQSRRSFHNGRVVLMEKGTQIVGEYRGGLQRGQKRLFVLWSRAKTPNGVIVTLASPAADALWPCRR